MRRSNLLILSMALVFCLPQVLLSDDAKQGIPLQGEYVGPGQPSDSRPCEIDVDKAAEESPGSVLSFQELPVIEEALAQKAVGMGPTELMRVIIFLDYQPQDVIAQQVTDRHAEQLEQIRADAGAINAKYARKRNLQAPADAENYRQDILALSSEDAQTMRTIAERHEALSLTVKNEIVAALSVEIGDYQQSVKDAIEDLGGVVEFSTIAGNAVVALIPVGILDEVGNLDKIARVVEDKLMEAHLNIADDATRVGDIGSLWDNGETGGLYDPAVLDSGTDLDHPALEDSNDRDNFYSWYLVAAWANRATNGWDDEISEDDLNGHGTHVIGIVGSYGSTGWTDYLGMSYGVDKAVTLKAGYNKTNGRAGMYYSDSMHLVDRALYHDEDLRPVDTFSDDVDGINLSYGGDAYSDETDYSRFWDSVVSSYTDLVVTISAGNSGPDNAYFCTPACAYNPITVASVDHENTTTRDDDEISWFSTRGPTDSGRRKPDIAAPGAGDSNLCCCPPPPFDCLPGHGIHSCNNDWETQADFVEAMGTSMAAPMVQGVAMDLMDAGVTDELKIKALLINTAQKNEPGIDFEDDADGWDEAFGWGYMNAWAAYYHRNDVITDSVKEKPNAGYYHLYKGQMHDEGSGGEGRDRVTMVWNRHATYEPNDYPGTYYSLSDLNLRLYRETDNVLIDHDFAGDNVHQVRIDSGAGFTDVIVKAYAYSTNFAHGGDTETFALATEEGFVEVELPGDFQGISNWPNEMEPGEERDFEFWLSNDSNVASHNNQFDLILPAGWSKLSGSDPYSAGSIAAGEHSSHITWTLKAQSTEEDGLLIKSRHTHDSYAESWGPFDWHMGVNVRWDTTPPSPDPMTWQTEPYQTSTFSISMVATTATDIHKPIDYHFFVYDLTDGGVYYDDDWQSSTTYDSTGLATNNCYRYHVRARDSATAGNTTGWSDPNDEYTDIETPSGITFGAVTTATIQAKSTNTPTGLTRDSSGLYIQNTTAGAGSGWKQNNNYWTCSKLIPDTCYYFRAKARNGDGDETPYCSSEGKYTLADTPDAPTVDNPTTSSLDITINPGVNPSYTQYAIGISGGGDSYYLNAKGGNNGTTPVWQSISSWGTVTAAGLQSNTTYAVEVKARNVEGFETAFGPPGYGTTLPVQYTLSVTSSPEINVLIDVFPDPNGTTPFTRDYVEETLLSLTAPQSHGDYWFVRWRLDDVNQPLGQQELDVTMDDDHDTQAVYAICGDADHPYPTGDLSQNCYVDWPDVDILGEHWLDTGCDDPNSNWCEGADLDESTDVRFPDFAILAAHWLDCTAPGPPCEYNP